MDILAKSSFKLCIEESENKSSIIVFFTFSILVITVKIAKILKRRKGTFFSQYGRSGIFRTYKFRITGNKNKLRELNVCKNQNLSHRIAKALLGSFAIGLKSLSLSIKGFEVESSRSFKIETLLATACKLQSLLPPHVPPPLSTSTFQNFVHIQVDKLQANCKQVT